MTDNLHKKLSTHSLYLKKMCHNRLTCKKPTDCPDRHLLCKPFLNNTTSIIWSVASILDYWLFNITPHNSKHHLTGGEPGRIWHGIFKQNLSNHHKILKAILGVVERHCKENRKIIKAFLYTRDLLNDIEDRLGTY